MVDPSTILENLIFNRKYILSNGGVFIVMFPIIIWQGEPGSLAKMVDAFYFFLPRRTPNVENTDGAFRNTNENVFLSWPIVWFIVPENPEVRPLLSLVSGGFKCNSLSRLPRVATFAKTHCNSLEFKPLGLAEPTSYRQSLVHPFFKSAAVPHWGVLPKGVVSCWSFSLVALCIPDPRTI